MVGLATNPETTPVPHAHTLIHHPNATISSVLSALTPPPNPPCLSEARVGEWAQCTAMVQDIWDAELFVASSPEGRSGLLLETGAVSDSTTAKLGERLPVYLVSPPGYAAWARVEEEDVGEGGGGMKRGREEDVDMVDDEEKVEIQGEKRVRAEGTSVGQNGSGAGPSQRVGLNLPVAGEKGASAVVGKIYDEEVGRGLKLHWMVQCIGIVQDGVEMEIGEEGAFSEELRARNPINVKRLHVVKMRRIEEKDLMWAWRQATLNGAVQRERRRELMIEYFASGFAGDRLAAEYLLLAAIARPNVRIAGGVLGNLSVNFVTEADVEEGLRKVCACVVSVSFDIATLNAVQLYPRKDYEINRLRAAPLQMGAGVLVVDERRLQNGQLAERGVKNVRAVNKVAKEGVVPVDFGFYEGEMEVGCGCVTVSKGKGIVETDVRVRVEGKGGEWKGDLQAVRSGVMEMLEGGPFEINEETSRVVEEDFVRERKAGGCKDGQEGLKRWLGVARACARSFGEGGLSVQRWKYVMDLEKRRCERDRV